MHWTIFYEYWVVTHSTHTQARCNIRVSVDTRCASRQLNPLAKAKAKGGRRGPQNDTIQHWHSPKAVVEIGTGKRWSFKCRYCSAVRTVPRTVDSESFQDEPRRPRLSNLASHTNEAHQDQRDAVGAGETTAAGETSTQPLDRGHTIAGNAVMLKFFEEGLANPRRDPTQKGFLRMFVAWIIEDDLPFTTGDDTTVRNVVAKIFISLHDNLVKQLSAINTWVAERDDASIPTLSPDDWMMLEHVGSVLSRFTKVTETMSRANTPTLPWVLPMYQHMHLSLDAVVRNDKLPANIRDAAAAASVKLQQYYNMAKKSHTNIIATDYLKAKHVFDYVFTSYQSSMPVVADQPGNQVVSHNSEPDDFLAALADIGFEQQAPVRESESERWYRGEGGQGNPNYPLLWWKVRQGRAFRLRDNY
ncbi:hypothetical protein FA95DRAFT_1658846 [Auriscalpium vulgare]|uniref:Uncharacterized protein n=1 Tax=Auriscalpium vulgare TaxID=40419 RepID=A0ACB8R5B8_9AGAM|nr:hypothetical protein FA95DRAFT_1658846 [Auriscalpium vulgare]